MKWQLVMASAIAIAFSAVSSALGYCPCVTDFSDDYDDGILADSWIYTTGCATAQEGQGKLILRRIHDCPSTSAWANMDPQLQTLCGDFDVSVDFQLINFPVPAGTSAIVATLEVNRTGGGTFAAIERYNRQIGACANDSINYKAWTTGSANCQASWASTRDMEGRFRINRAGSVVRMFYWNSDWVEMRCDTLDAGDVVVMMRTSSLDGANASLEVHYDNLTIQSDLGIAPWPNGLVSWWPADNGGPDIQGTNHTTLYNGLAIGAGKVERAFQFDGVDDYVSTQLPPSNLDMSGAFSYLFWFKTTQSTIGTIINYFNGGTGRGFVSQLLPTSKLYCDIYAPFSTNWKRVESGQAVNDGVWHLAALTRNDSGTISLYIDNALADTATVIGDATAAGANVVIGTRQPAPPADMWAGAIDEVQFFNRELGAAEIRAIFDAGCAGQSRTGVGQTDVALALPGVRVLSVSPNPSPGGEVAVHFRVESSRLPTDVSVIDVSGRRVRTLISGMLAPGDREAHWNGCDKNGAAVPAGVYFLRHSWGSVSQATARVIVVR